MPVIFEREYFMHKKFQWELLEEDDRQLFLAVLETKDDISSCLK